MKHFILFFLINILFLGIGFPVQAQGNEPEQYVQVSVITNQTNVSGGETIRLGIQQNIYPKWHTYWINPGDSGLATAINWDLPAGFEAGDLEWPVPEKIPFGPLTNYGYEGDVVLLQNLTIPSSTGTDPITLKGTVDLLVCHDICIPESHDVSLTLNGDAQPQAEKISAAEKKLPQESIGNVTYSDNGSDLVFEIPAPSNAASIKSVELLPLTWGGVSNPAEARFTVEENILTVTQAKAEGDGQELQTYPLLIKISDQNGDESVYSIEAKKNASSPAIKNTEASETIESDSVSFWQAALFAIFGGIILNLMPCVFPVLSMKALSLVKLKGEEEKEARRHGIAYTAGILISFALIGGVLIALKAAGAEIGWGFQLQNPVIILSLAYLVFIIGLNLAGYFEFSNAFAGVGQKQAQASGTKGAFFTGVLATLVATPCTAPFMGVALGYALTQNAVIAMSVFLALGFGLALPYLALCYIPSLREKLPKPGLWMDQFKQFLAFPMFLTTAWLVWVLAQQGGSTVVAVSLVGMVLIALGLWLHKNFLSNGKKSKTAFVAISVTFILLIGTFNISNALNIRQEKNETAQESGQNWEDFSNEKLNTLLDGDQPIFTNMTAAWCITCQVNDRVALKRDAAKELFAEKNIAYLKGDWTLKDAEITKYLNKFDRQGVPMYVYYGPRDTATGKRPEPVVLPQILTPSIVEDVIHTH